jgi:hypothetical protein
VSFKNRRATSSIRSAAAFVDARGGLTWMLLIHRFENAPVPTAIDTGTLFVTNQRVVFQGGRQIRECRFDKMVAIHHTPDGTTVFSVSNRQKPTTVAYGTEIAGWFEFRLELALAHYRNDVPTLFAQLREHLAAVDAEKPSPPELPAG